MLVGKGVRNKRIIKFEMDVRDHLVQCQEQYCQMLGEILPQSLLRALFPHLPQPQGRD